MSMKKLPPHLLRQHKGISFPGISTAFICHDGKGNVFMAQRSKNTRDEHGRWDAGGGGLKHGQSLHDNLVREVKEEYNATPLKVEFLGYMDAFRETEDGQPTHWLAMYFTVLIDPKEVHINEPDMVDDHGWFPIDNLPTPIHSLWDKFYELHGKNLRVAIGATPSA